MTIAVIFDVDNCLSNDGRRICHLPDHEKYHEGQIEDHAHSGNIMTLISYLERGYHVLVVTGRPERYRMDTMRWLNKFILSEFKDCVSYHFRDDLDQRSSVEVKKAIVQNLLKTFDIRQAFDDRKDIVDMYKSLGIVAHVMSINGAQEPIVPEAHVVRPAPQLDPVQQALQTALATWQSRNVVYGNGYERVGAMLALLHSTAPPPTTATEYALRYYMEQIMVKLMRAANNGGDHPDSFIDLINYSAICIALLGAEDE